MKSFHVLLGAAGAALSVSVGLMLWPSAGDRKPGSSGATGTQAVKGTATAAGDWITFLSHQSGQNLLYKIRPDGSEVIPIFGGEQKGMPGLSEGMTWFREPHWTRQSPDGKYFLSWAIDRGPVHRYRSPPRFLLHLGRTSGGPTRLLTPDSGEVFTWAPDSRQFAYARSLWGHPATINHPVDPRTELVVAPLDGSFESVVLDRAGVWSPADWSPDGTRLLVSYMSSPVLQRTSTALFELDLREAEAAMKRSREQAQSFEERDAKGGVKRGRPEARAAGLKDPRMRERPLFTRRWVDRLHPLDIGAPA